MRFESGHLDLDQIKARRTLMTMDECEYHALVSLDNGSGFNPNHHSALYERMVGVLPEHRTELRIQLTDILLGNR